MSTVATGIHPSLIVQGQQVALYATITNSGANDLSISQVVCLSPASGVVIDDSGTLLPGKVIPAGTSVIVRWTARLLQAYPDPTNLTFSYRFFVTDAVTGTVSLLTPTQNPSVTVMPGTSDAGNTIPNGLMSGPGSLFFNNSTQSGLIAAD